MGKHTPGPWEASVTGGRQRAVFKVGDPGGQICKLPGALFGGDAETKEANARLIAAAPDMLDLIDTIENDDGKIPDWLWEKIRDVSAKAGGRWSRSLPPPSNPPGRKP